MEINSLVKVIRDINDIDDIEGYNYINIDIDTANIDVLRKLLDRRLDSVLFSDYMDNKIGNVYTGYNDFREGAKIIIDIVSGINKDYNDIEKVRYLYIKLGKLMGYDINSMQEKNDDFTFNNIGVITNIFSSIRNNIGNNESITKIYMYLCNLSGIKCYIKDGCNIISVDGNILKVCLPLDIPLIKAGFKTSNFDIYNDDKKLDKKVGYIKEEYNDMLLDKEIKTLKNENSDISRYLDVCKNIINIWNMGAIEQGIIYDLIFRRYMMDDIEINNFYVKSNSEKKHIIIISNNDRYYSFNYNTGKYQELPIEILENGLNSGKIGIYQGEKINRFNR